MNIVTKTGDDGTTGLLYGGRIRKDHPLIQTIGDIDELNAALGLIKCNDFLPFDGDSLIQDIQQDLVSMMGEIACSDRIRFKEEKIHITENDVTVLEEACTAMQNTLEISSWETPSGPIDFAVRIARRAERGLLSLRNYENNDLWGKVGPLIPVGKFPDSEYLRNNIKLRPILNIYLNRLSDVLWLMARFK